MSSLVRKWWIGLAALIVVAIVAVAVWPGEREPEYQGKKLSEWVEVARNPDFAHAQQADAEAAVRSIGTNALPLLLKWVNYSPASWKLKVSDLTRKLLFVDLGNDLESWLTKTDKRRFTVAIKAFQILGPVAAPAVSRLKEIAADKNTRFGPEIMRMAAAIEVWVQMEQRQAQDKRWE